MASAASLYEAYRPENPIGTSGQAFDAGQFASANNLFAEPTTASQWTAGLSAAGQIIGGLGGLISNNTALKAQASNYRSAARALARTRDRFISTFNRESEQLDASQIVGYISSGLSIDSGTPQAVRAATTNQRGKELSWQVQNYNTEIRNLKRAAKATERARGFGNLFSAASLGIGVATGGVALGLFGGE